MAGAPREVELKLKVPDERALEQVRRVSQGRAEAPVEQVNHFFDTPGRSLNQSRFVLRLRQEGTTFAVTAKGPSVKSADGVLTSRDEVEVPVSAEAARRFLSGADSPFSAFDAVDAASQALIAALKAAAREPLEHIGEFRNTRTRVHAGLGTFDAVLELDRTVYPGPTVHCEVELEVPPGVDPADADQALRALLAKAGVTGTVAPSKAKRFFAALAGKPI